MLLTVISCDNDDNELPIVASCDVANPIQNLEWLKSLVESKRADESTLAKYFYLEIAEYENETVFIDNNCCPICNTVVPFYNCDGELLGTLNSEINADFRNRKIIFKRDDFECSVH